MADKLTQIGAEMIAYAHAHKYDPLGSPIPFQRTLGHGLRLTCYARDSQFTLNIERRYRELEKGESYITRLAFHVPRSAKSTPIPAHDGWRGVRMTWDMESDAERNANAERQPATTPQQAKLF